MKSVGTTKANQINLDDRQQFMMLKSRASFQKTKGRNEGLLDSRTSQQFCLTNQNIKRNSQKNLKENSINCSQE